jgi:hypothetical protein
MKKYLINLIISFLDESKKSYDNNQSLDKSNYLEIAKCLNLFFNEIDSDKKYKYFLKYVNDENRRVEKNLFETEILNDSLSLENFLRMQFYFIRIKDRITNII